jgi:PKD repeat protein
LSGTPATAGTYSLTITAKNSVGSDTQTFTLTVS